MSTPENAHEAAFSATWRRDGPRVAAYARRHVAPDDVQDVVAETFVQAWRHWEEVPEPPIGWLIATARKVIGNSRRSVRRRTALLDRLALLDRAARPESDAALLATDRMSALEALAALPDGHREALLLVSWDGLAPDAAAEVLGIRPGAFRVRAHRARAALGDLDPPAEQRTATTRRPLTEGGLR
ncbi:RNA polymerase sigma factor [Nocardioides sp. R1-1]|uniref:RNA polymerase sigma factor n=1 Tax=Nocardioides sp. R1-1 TaxID=3383502 RepID=UPI0038D24784